MDDSGRQREQSSTLTGIGVTLIGVILSVAASLALGISAAWWIRTLVGAGTAVLLITLVKVGTRHGPSGPLARMARWIIGGPV